MDVKIPVLNGCDAREDSEALDEEHCQIAHDPVDNGFHGGWHTPQGT